MPIVLITGAAGHIGTMLRPRLARPGRALRLLDTGFPAASTQTTRTCPRCRIPQG
jgi:nucleoside-diphosphate-sugar epimerase